MSSARRLVLLCLAFFAVIASPALADGTLRVSMSGPGSVTGTGINCARGLSGAATGDCVEAFVDKKVCVLDEHGKPECEMVAQGTALKATVGVSGFVFDGWTGDCSGRTCDVALSDDLGVTAHFRDAVAPSVSLGGVASGAVVRGNVPLSASASDNAGVTRVIFAVGGTTIVDEQPPYAATIPIAGMKDGNYDASAKAFDAAGLSSTSSVPVTVDNTAPSVGVNGPASGAAFTGGTTQTWTLAVTDTTATSVKCSVVPLGTPAAFGACSGGAGAHSVSGKPHGAYVFSVRATDAAGNVADVTRSFSIDTVAPVTTVISDVEDGATTTSTSIGWSFSANEPGVSYACRVHPAALTPGPFGPCSSAAGHVAAGFAPGVYAFEVRATDAVGNAESTPIKRTFTVAPAPPPPPATVVDPVTPQPTPSHTGTGTGSVLSGAKSSTAAPQIVVTLAFSFSSSTKKQTKLTSLVVKGVPAGSTVSAKGFKKTNAAGIVSLKSLTKKPLKAGSTITVTVSHPAMSSAIKTLKILPRKSPVVTTQCQPPGSKPKPC
ncbi:Ig-like domain-containing protein [Solirubrobacter phytolaccae]|uniref:Ig-like domain-containing protein n=1 Tax=Solirubrobacter phytolaccae TaxID=1404360 RepID=A0A9X3N567_9ACTN|nr:Ig-like domain-containing protein [Solirubrobacter phytolaccae]MDA0179933.1 Ig-like domain-containing protein [Solirubrobacter phytolaccae]